MFLFDDYATFDMGLFLIGCNLDGDKTNILRSMRYQTCYKHKLQQEKKLGGGYSVP
jgi:hypothetical protein